MKAIDKEIHIIPEILEPQKSKLYSILSKGVHEYDENECYEMYPILKYVITKILDNYLIQKEEEKKLKEISKFLATKEFSTE